jgi:hypothetical protein
MITWGGRQKFRTYDPGKIKYGIQVRMVYEVWYCVIFVTWRYMQLRRGSWRTVLSLLDRSLGHTHHIYQDTFYSSVRLAQTLLDRNMGVFGTMRANRGIPHDLEWEGKPLKKGHSAFWSKGDLMVQVINMIHDATIVNTGRKDRKTSLEIKKPYSVVPYSKFMVGIGRTDQYLTFYSFLRKTVKWLKRVVFVSSKCCTLQFFFFFF